MHCAGCVASVEKSLLAVDGVESAVVNLPLENVRIKKNSQVSFRNYEMLFKLLVIHLLKSNPKIFQNRKRRISTFGDNDLYG